MDTQHRSLDNTKSGSMVAPCGDQLFPRDLDSWAGVGKMDFFIKQSNFVFNFFPISKLEFWEEMPQYFSGGLVNKGHLRQPPTPMISTSDTSESPLQDYS